MTVQRGKQFLLKAGDGGGPETFTTVAKLRTTGLRINGTTVDIGNKDSGGFQELLDAGGVVSLEFTASGIFSDEASQTVLEDRALANTVDNYQLVFGSGRTIECGFIITQCEYAGDWNGEATYNVSGSSSGTPTVS